MGEEEDQQEGRELSAVGGEKRRRQTHRMHSYSRGMHSCTPAPAVGLAGTLQRQGSQTQGDSAATHFASSLRGSRMEKRSKKSSNMRRVG